MNETNSRKNWDRWLFVVSLGFLVAVFVWSLSKQPAAPDSPPKRFISPPPRVEITPVENSLYSLEELTYFQDIAFNAEHVDLSHRIRKWTENINVRIAGDPTKEDLLAVEKTIEEINNLQASVTLTVDYFDTNMLVRFAPEESFIKFHGNYQPMNLGYFWVRWMDEVIYAANILIDTSQTTQEDRNGLIKEEMMQAMGLMNVSSRYKDSIFNDSGDTYPSQLSPLDRVLLEMLYRPEITPSMNPEQALGLLSTIPADSD